MSSQLHRRTFLKGSILASFASGAAVGLGLPIAALAASGPAPKTLLNISLRGGIDPRFLFVPAPNHDEDVSTAGYTEFLWSARKGIYPAGYRRYADMFVNEYLPVTDPRTGFQFGIHQTCSLLKNEFEQQRVAIIANQSYATEDWISKVVGHGRPAALELHEAGRDLQAVDGAITPASRYDALTQNLSDLFDGSGGLAQAKAEIYGLMAGEPAERAETVLSSGLGATSLADGQPGAGSGIHTVVYGRGVRGGVYGEMFPDHEMIPGVEADTSLGKIGSGINLGLMFS